ncbi:MAG: lamin tail domain-containing protein [Akkermansiaceae bacterium]
MKYLPFSLPLLTLLPLHGQVLITQYYEGTSNNKFLEITNTGAAAIDLSTYTLARFINSGAEDWKTDGVPNATEPLSGTLAAGASYVFANGSAVIPFDADQANQTSSIITFNGNDSMVLYNGDLLSANIADAFSVIDGSANISVLRKTTAQGYDLVGGSTFENFAEVWEIIDLDTANAASLGEDAFIGSSDLGSSSPVISFSIASEAVAEDSGSVELEVKINNPDGQEVSVDVVFDLAASTVESAEVGDYITQTVTFPASAISGDTRSVTVTLGDDMEEEASEQAVFNLENLQTTGSAILGGGQTFTLSVLDDDTFVAPLYISEIADPADAPSGRFVEIYNPTDADVDLSLGNWNLIVYFNGNTSGSSIPLFGVIEAGTTFVVANRETAFAETYQDAAAADQYSGSINSNGNETFELRFGGDEDTGVVVDIFGVVGTNGAGTEYDFIDSQLTRTGPAPKPIFDPADWAIVSGANASDMTPGSLVPVDPPVVTAPRVISLTVDPTTGDSSLIVADLGVRVFDIQHSDDLNQADSWEVLGAGFTESDNPDGTTTLIFNDPDILTSGLRFYRLKEVQ